MSNKNINPGVILAKQRWYKNRKPSKNKVLMAAAMLGQSGGRVGGPARADALTDKQRSQISIHAANTRWGLPCGCKYCKMNA